MGIRTERIIPAQSKVLVWLGKTSNMLWVPLGLPLKSQMARHGTLHLLLRLGLRASMEFSSMNLIALVAPQR